MVTPLTRLLAPSVGLLALLLAPLVGPPTFLFALPLIPFAVFLALPLVAVRPLSISLHNNSRARIPASPHR